MIIGTEGGQVEGNSQRGTRPLQGLEIPHGKRTGKPLQCFDQECLSVVACVSQESLQLSW